LGRGCIDFVTEARPLGRVSVSEISTVLVSGGAKEVTSWSHLLMQMVLTRYRTPPYVPGGSNRSGPPLRSGF